MDLEALVATALAGAAAVAVDVAGVAIVSGENPELAVVVPIAAEVSSTPSPAGAATVGAVLDVLTSTFQLHSGPAVTTLVVSIARNEKLLIHIQVQKHKQHVPTLASKHTHAYTTNIISNSTYKTKR